MNRTQNAIDRERRASISVELKPSRGGFGGTTFVPPESPLAGGSIGELKIVIWGGLLSLVATVFGWHFPFSQVTPGP
ncbi:MAG: hypothetical protein HW404_1380, partial [Anaerolineales bacterium]|nr:hypothetical protein [Anaerolineales bacterium]